MATIRATDRPFDLTEQDVFDEVAAVIAQPPDTTPRALIAPATAVAIASWWQSPGRVGHALASFASGCEIDRDVVLEDVALTRPQARTSRDDDALRCLADFITHHGTH